MEFRVTRAKDVPQHVVTDEKKLRQVLVNLLDNAMKFTEEGGIRLNVGVQRVSSGAVRLEVEVEDTGVGIAPKDMDLLFEYFEQAGAGRHAETGTGLGLAISRTFVRLLGGELMVRSDVGRGSVFSFDIVAEMASETDVVAVSDTRRVTGLQPDERSYRVLVADDAEDNRELLAQLLLPIGFDVRTVSDGEQAVEEFETWHPNLILMDMRMPVMDGYEATRQIRMMPGGADVSIIGVTASVFSEDRRRVLDAGADCAMGKPCRDSALLDKIAELLHVEYVYEDDLLPVPETGDALDAGALTVLPGDLMERIRRATVSADFDSVLDLVDEVGQTDKRLAAGLRNLAGRFDSERILGALTEVEES